MLCSPWHPQRRPLNPCPSPAQPWPNHAKPAYGTCGHRRKKGQQSVGEVADVASTQHARMQTPVKTRQLISLGNYAPPRAPPQYARPPYGRGLRMRECCLTIGGLCCPTFCVTEGLGPMQLGPERRAGWATSGGCLAGFDRYPLAGRKNIAHLH